MPLEALGEPIGDWVRLSQCAASWRAGNEIVGRVAHIDRFGNVITDVGEEMLAGMDRARIVVMIRGKTIRSVKAAYSTVAAGEPLALVGSSGHLEIAVREGSAARLLGIQFGDEVVVSA